MFNKLIAFSLIVFVFACSPKKDTPNTSNSVEKPSTETPIVDAPKSDKPSLKSLESYVGKKPSEVQLFDNADLTQRIEKLLGADYADFKADWNEESPIMKDGEILYFIGCKSGACAENKYFIMLDLVDPNINIINMRNGRPRSYEEGAVIGMPDTVAEAFDKTRQSQGL